MSRITDQELSLASILEAGVASAEPATDTQQTQGVDPSAAAREHFRAAAGEYAAEHIGTPAAILQATEIADRALISPSFPSEAFAESLDAINARGQAPHNPNFDAMLARGPSGSQHHANGDLPTDYQVINAIAGAAPLPVETMPLSSED